MTYITLKIKAAATILTLATAAFCISAPASAGPQDDVQSCRDAMSTQSNIDMSTYRLRFEGSKGYRARTLRLKAIPKRANAKKGSQSFRFSCHINQKGAVALNRKNGTTQFAKVTPRK